MLKGNFIEHVKKYYDDQVFDFFTNFNFYDKIIDESTREMIIEDTL
jgi:hypothetical protein